MPISDMKDTRNVRLLISLVVLLVITGGVFFLQQDKAKVSVDALLFRPENANAINHVVIVSKTKKIDLHFDGRFWKLNDKFDADEQLIKVLMATVLQVTPKRPVAIHQRDSINALLESMGAKVSLYTDAGLDKQFVAGGNAEKTAAYFKDEKSGEIYLMTIPGYRVYASGVFELDENGWRDKRIFNFNWRNFRQLTFTWTKDPASNFEFIKQKDFLGIVGLENPDSARVNNFLNDVLTLTADQIVIPGSSKVYDSISKTTPILQIVVSDIGKQNYTLDLFQQLKGDNKLVGKAWGGEVVVFDRRKLFSVIKKRGYFKAK